MAGPDRGWSWVVAFAACFTSLVLAGIFRTSGVLFVAFIGEYGVSREAAAWPMVVCITVLNFTGPISGMLGQKFGIRPIVLSGALIGAIGVSACFFTTSLLVTTVFFGGVFGFGYGLVATLIPVIVNAYFLKQRGTANGIANSGSCFGSILLPILYEFLLDWYGLSGCFLITGGIVLNLAVAGALLRPPSFSISEKDVLRESNNSLQGNIPLTPVKYLNGFGNTERNGEKPTNCEGAALLDHSSLTQKSLHAELVDVLNRRNNIPEIQFEGSREQSYKTCISYDDSLSSRWKSNEDHVDLDLERAEKQFEDSLNDFEAVALNIIETSKSDEVLNRYDSENSGKPSQITDGCPARHSFSLTSAKRHFKSPIPNSGPLKKCSYRLRTPSGDTHNSELYPVCEDMTLKVPANTETVAEVDETTNFVDIPQDTPPSKKSDGPTIKETLLSFKTVFSSSLFHLTAFTNVTFYFIFHMYVNVVVDYALDRGIPLEDTKHILFAFSIADLFGRLCLGWVTDKRLMTRSRFVMSGMAGISLVFLVLPFATDYWSLIAVSCCYGIFLGSTMILFPILLVDFLGSELHAVTYGCLCFMNGFSSLLRPFLIGYFRDNIGSYEHIFYILGGISLFASATWVLERFLLPKTTKETEIN